MRKKNKSVHELQRSVVAASRAMWQVAEVLQRKLDAERRPADLTNAKRRRERAALLKRALELPPAVAASPRLAATRLAQQDAKAGWATLTSQERKRAIDRIASRLRRAMEESVAR